MPMVTVEDLKPGEWFIPPRTTHGGHRIEVISVEADEVLCLIDGWSTLDRPTRKPLALVQNYRHCDGGPMPPGALHIDPADVPRWVRPGRTFHSYAYPMSKDAPGTIRRILNDIISYFEPRTGTFRMRFLNDFVGGHLPTAPYSAWGWLRDEMVLRQHPR